MANYSILQQFYNSKEWRNLRLLLIAERGNKCQQCGNIIPRAIDIIGHHKTELTPENMQDNNISLNPDNILLVCKHCHDTVLHKRFNSGGGRHVYLVYGAPLSGKTTFVYQRMTRGDIVVDIDKLYEAVSLLPMYDKPNNLFNNVIGIHNLLIDNIKTRLGKWNNAWIVGGYADKYKREKLANELGAELVFIDVSKDECISRLRGIEGLQYRQDEYIKHINKWFEEYGG